MATGQESRDPVSDVDGIADSPSPGPAAATAAAETSAADKTAAATPSGREVPAATNPPKRDRRLLTAAAVAVAVTAAAAAYAMELWGFDGGAAASSGAVPLPTGHELNSVIISPSTWDDDALGGPNNHDVVWAVYFYKPYCGACRRVGPTIHSLADTSHGAGVLRFAAIDCVAHTTICTKADAEQHPQIKLYKWRGGNGREEVQRWQGMLVGYEVLNWFKQLQSHGHIATSVQWPDADTLAEATLRRKAEGEFKTKRMGHRPSRPDGYKEDMASALSMALTDHVFPTDHAMSPHRTGVLLSFITAASETYPSADVRSALSNLKTILKQHNTPWQLDEWNVMVDQWRANSQLPTNITDQSWNWCSPERRGGRGGYACGLWVLFHGMLANCGRESGGTTLTAIADFVTAPFFGCSECASHFGKVWKKDKGASVNTHMDAVLWLWRAHNKVSARLNKEAESAGASTSADGMDRSRLQVPTPMQCEDCYKEGALKPITRPNGRPITRQGPDGKRKVVMAPVSNYDAKVWDEGNTFMWLQETYCHASDGFTCASFYDPSQEDSLGSVLKLVGYMTLIGVAAVALLLVCASIFDGGDDGGQ